MVGIEFGLSYYDFVVSGEGAVQFDQNLSEGDERGAETFLCGEEVEETLEGEAESSGFLMPPESSLKSLASGFDIGPGN